MKRVLVIALTALCLVLSTGSPVEAQKARKYKVLASVSSTTIISGQTVYVTGTVKPSAIGRTAPGSTTTS